MRTPREAFRRRHCQVLRYNMLWLLRKLVSYDEGRRRAGASVPSSLLRTLRSRTADFENRRAEEYSQGLRLRTADHYASKHIVYFVGRTLFRFEKQ